MRRTPEIQKRRILDAARRAFARDGLEGARVDAIAANADVNKRMLYHYFGDKQALFDAALEDCLEQLREELSQPPWQRDACRVEAWQLLAGLSGSGRSMPLRLSESLNSWLPQPDSADAGSRALVLIALELLEALLPDLVESRLGPFAGLEDRHVAMAGLMRRFSAVAAAETQKPRIKLQPRVQPA
ncbi:MAG: helix-turn-helix domain-containing protein [Pseudomonadales bacterium]